MSARLPAGDPTVRWQLGRRSRRAVLVLHIASSGAWIGIDVVLGVLVFTALLTDDPRTAALSYQALALFAVWPLFTAGLVCLASGVTLGIGTNYGLVRYWWIAVKLALNIVLTGLVLVALRPTVAAATRYGEALAQGQPVTGGVRDLIFPPIVSSTALLVAMTLAVYKPWGRIRPARAERSRTRSPTTTAKDDEDDTGNAYQRRIDRDRVRVR